MNVVEALELPLSLCDPPARPRRSVMNEAKLRELAESLAMVGQRQPIQVIRRGARYEVVVGHRRLLAGLRLGWKSLRAEVVEGSDRDVLLARVHENSKRDDLSPLERATEARDCLEAAGGNIEEAALMLGMSVSVMDSWLEVLEWPRDVQEALDRGDIKRSVARWLARITNDGDRAHHLKYAIDDGCTEVKARFWFQEWHKTGLLAEVGKAPLPLSVSGLPPKEPTWPCYLCLDELSFGSLYTVRVCEVCAPVIAANRAEGKSQDPNLGLLG